MNENACSDRKWWKLNINATHDRFKWKSLVSWLSRRAALPAGTKMDTMKNCDDFAILSKSFQPTSNFSSHNPYFYYRICLTFVSPITKIQILLHCSFSIISLLYHPNLQLPNIYPLPYNIITNPRLFHKAGSHEDEISNETYDEFSQRQTRRRFIHTPTLTGRNVEERWRCFQLTTNQRLHCILCEPLPI